VIEDGPNLNFDKEFNLAAENMADGGEAP
jgi:hypothetical protein